MRGNLCRGVASYSWKHGAVDFREKIMFVRRTISLAATYLLLAVMHGFGANPGLKVLPGHVPAILAQLVPEGIVPATNR